MKHQRSHEKKHDPKCELVFSIKDGAVCTCKPIEETPSPKCTCGGNYHDSACQLQQFNDRELPSPELAEKCDCKDESCKEDCKRNHTHKRFFCEKCEPVYPDVPEEKPYRQTRPDGWTRTDKCRHSLSTLCSYCEPPEKPVEENKDQYPNCKCGWNGHKKPEPQNKADWEEIDINKTGYAGLDLPLSWEEKVRQMLREIDRAEIDDSRLYELIRQTILSERKAEREEIVKLVEKKKKKEKLGKYCKNCGEEIGYDRAQGLYFCGTCPFTSSEAKEDLVKMEFSEYNQTLDDLLAFLREEE